LYEVETSRDQSVALPLPIPPHDMAKPTMKMRAARRFYKKGKPFATFAGLLDAAHAGHFMFWGNRVVPSHVILTATVRCIDRAQRRMNICRAVRISNDD
jgi:hypothetical protein